MKWIRDRVRAGKVLGGAFLNLGSSVTAEIAGKCGFDWILIDLEHGAGDRGELLHQLQAVEGSTATPIVRIGWNEAPTFKRILDLGPSGIMVPWVSNAEEARRAAASMLFPPQGIRGVASSTRASGFAMNFEEYFRDANEQLLLVTQIETREGLENAAEIAAVDRVDVLFVGPLDLSVSLGMPRQFDRPEFRQALGSIVAAAKRNGKAAGILAATPEQIPSYVEAGFTFIACGSDGGIVAQGLKNIATAFGKLR